MGPFADTNLFLFTANLIFSVSHAFVEKSDKISTKVCDTEKIRLAVKRNKFVSANGVEIKKDTDISSDIRALLNHLVNKEQITKSTEDKSDIKGMIRADCKTIVEIVNDEKCNNEKGI